MSKLVSIISNHHLQKLQSINGINYQFGTIPQLSYQDVVFTLKSLLQEKREKGIDTFIVFVDLVKAYDSVQYHIIKKSLEILGDLIEIVAWTMKLY